MDIEKAKEILESTDTDFTIKNRVLRGMVILVDSVGPDIDEPRFEHDQMWYADFEDTVTKMREGTVEMMASLGWFEGEDAWSHS